jgi:glycogen phosphorylase
MLSCNPGLAALIDSWIGPEWVTDLTKIAALEAHASKKGFGKDFIAVKRANKQALSNVVYDTTRITIDPDTLFDCQAKRIHEYKRQLLNAMHIIHQYLLVTEDGAELPCPRTYIFAGKAAPGYYMAKLIIKLINSVGYMINANPAVKGQIRVAFIPDYKVSVAERLIPAADLSEQISTAGMEASGTGNMKFAMNGALTAGTLDGANVEMAEEVGDENIYMFGYKTHEIPAMREAQSYQPWEYYHANDNIRRVMDAIAGDRFCKRDPGLFQPIFDSVMHHGDFYYHLADFQSYIDIQHVIGQDFLDKRRWAEKAILNVARMSKFLSDRTISQYAEEIWHAKSIA